MDNIKRIVAIYIRVSTDKQEIENQVGQLTKYIENKPDYELFHTTYSDVISGSKDKRPGFDKLFYDAHYRLFSHVLFWSLDRFSRSGTLFTLQKLKELENLGISWESYTEQYFNSIGEFKDVVISIMSTLAKIERQKISERTKAGLERAKLSGKKLGRPFGSKDAKKRNKSNYYKRYELANNGVSNNE